MTKEARKVPCPRCGKLSPYRSENRWRPFCSERCKMIDLGAWGSEQYRVASREKPEDSEEPKKEE